MDRAGYRVTSLPGLEEPLDFEQYAGFVPVNTRFDGHMFFWLCEAKTEPVTAPLVIWLNGGTGTSSLVGLFMENGPFVIEPDLSLRQREASWNRHANMLYIDQPLGAGYSYVQKEGLVSDDREITVQLYEFLVGFFEIFPEYLGRQVFITGESFAGHYIPRIAFHVLEQNDRGAGPTIPLVGLAVGNGWVDPEIHYSSYADYALANALIDEHQATEIGKLAERCRLGFDQHPEQGDKACDLIVPTILQLAAALVPGDDGELEEIVPNIYDIRLYGEFSPILLTPGYPPGKELLSPYLNQEDVRRAVHSEGPDPWVSLNMDLVERLQGIVNKNSRQIYQELIEHLRILFYSGIFDLMVNHLGTTRFLHRLDWSGRDEFLAAPQRAWPVGRRAGGFVKEAEGNPLTWLMVRNAGHLVPYDVPRVSQVMIDTFLADRSFVTHPVPEGNLVSPPLGEIL